MKIGVIGAGSWGTALAHLVSSSGNDVTIWAFEPEVVDDINKNHANSLFQPGISLSPSLRATGEIEEAAQGAEFLLCVTPSHVVRQVFENVADIIPPNLPIVSATKGLETDTLMTMSQVLSEVVGGQNRIGVLSGPSFAADVLHNLPTAVAVASTDHDLADKVRDVCSTERFRVYSRDDLLGLEIGGALKNVFAISAGIVDGLNWGDNARAAMITRGLAEMTRLGVAMGAKAETFAGLGGIGDLVLTCTGDQSRNRTVGLRLGAGESLEQIMDGRHTVAEGVKTTQAAARLAEREGVDMPIVTQINAVLDGKISPEEALTTLMTRDLKRENP